LSVIWPWLGVVKRTQAAAVLEVLRSQAVLARGRRDGGSHKTHCVNGHEYATTRIRPYVSRGKDEEPRASEQCLQCAREQARERRKQKKSTALGEERRSCSEIL